MSLSAPRGHSLALVGAVAALAVGLALLVRDPYLQLVLSLVPVWACVGLSWNLFSGYTGLISFGHATFIGLGAFTVAVLAVFADVTPWAGIPAGGVVAGVAALLIGSVTFRLRGHYFALAMLAYPSLFIFLFDWLGWQEFTFPLHPEAPAWFMRFTDPRVNTLLGAGLMTALLLITLAVERSRFGLAMLSIKQNEHAAEAAGVDTFRIKMLAFVLSGALGGVVGGFYAVVLQLVTPGGMLGPLVSAQALIISLFGGVGTLWGPVIGAAVLIPLTEALRAFLGHVLPGVQGVVYGLVIIVVVVVAPEGVFWRVRDLLARRRPDADRVTAGVVPEAPLAPGPGAALEVSGLSKAFGGLQALRDVSFVVRPGTVVGIIGPNGAGKTTLFNLLNGFYATGAGRVTFGGRVLTGLRPNRICRLGIGRTFQVARPFARMSVLDNVAVGALSVTADTPGAMAQAWHALRTVGLADKAGSGVKGLTNLELRLMELARALASRPRLLLLDETLAGLGGAEVEAILPVIRGLPEAGVTVVIIEHTMHAMTRLAQEFIVLDHGQVIASGEPGAVMRRREVIEAYLGKRWSDAHAHA